MAKFGRISYRSIALIKSYVVLRRWRCKSALHLASCMFARWFAPEMGCHRFDQDFTGPAVTDADS